MTYHHSASIGGTGFAGDMKGSPLHIARPRRIAGASRFALFLAALGMANTAMASGFEAGRYVTEGVRCETANEARIAMSTGFSVSPLGSECRVISRTSTGRYYPIYNQRCTSEGRSERVDLHVADASHISLHHVESGKVRAYRLCPLKKEARP